MKSNRMTRGWHLDMERLTSIKGGFVMDISDRKNQMFHKGMPYLLLEDQIPFDDIQKQILEWKKLEIDTFIIYPSFYFSEEYIEFIKRIVEFASKEKMHVWLYERIPQTTDINQVAKVLQVKEVTQWSEAICVPLQPNERIVSTYLVSKNHDGTINEDKITCIYPLNTPIIQWIDSTATIHDTTIQPFFQTNRRSKKAYECIFLIESTINNETNPILPSDLLNSEWMHTFILQRLDRYKMNIGAYFGTTISGILLEDAQTMIREENEKEKLWTKTFEQILYQEDVHMEELLALFYNIGEKTESVKEKYNKIIRNRIIETFEAPIIEWCETNKLIVQKV